MTTPPDFLLEASDLLFPSQDRLDACELLRKGRFGVPFTTSESLMLEKFTENLLDEYFCSREVKIPRERLFVIALSAIIHCDYWLELLLGNASVSLPKYFENRKLLESEHLASAVIQCGRIKLKLSKYRQLDKCRLKLIRSLGDILESHNNSSESKRLIRDLANYIELPRHVEKLQGSLLETELRSALDQSSATHSKFVRSRELEFSFLQWMNKNIGSVLEQFRGGVVEGGVGVDASVASVSEQLELCRSMVEDLDKRVTAMIERGRLQHETVVRIARRVDQELIGKGLTVEAFDAAAQRDPLQNRSEATDDALFDPVLHLQRDWTKSRSYRHLQQKYWHPEVVPRKTLARIRAAHENFLLRMMKSCEQHAPFQIVLRVDNRDGHTSTKSASGNGKGGKKEASPSSPAVGSAGGKLPERQFAAKDKAMSGKVFPTRMTTSPTKDSIR